MDTLVEHSRTMIRKGSRSFAGAAALLPPATRDSVYMLYAWCRHCDDRIDFQDHGHGGPGASGGAAARLRQLRDETDRALAGKPVEDPAFAALQRVVREHRIDPRHPFELLDGFAMDVENRRYRTLDDTLEYCYHVAGVVGVMMAHVMGAHEPDALDRASDLGLAFQLTNIARDVADDASAGRVYLPVRWLEEAGVPADGVLDPQHRNGLAEVVRRLLGEAERYYESAEMGLRWLDPRCAWSIAAARRIYREIGRVVEERGAAAWDERTVIPSRRKALLALRGGIDMLAASAPGAKRRAASRGALWTRPQS